LPEAVEENVFKRQSPFQTGFPFHFCRALESIRREKALKRFWLFMCIYFCEGVRSDNAGCLPPSLHAWNLIAVWAFNILLKV